MSGASGSTPMEYDGTTIDGEEAIGAKFERDNTSGTAIVQIAYLTVHDGTAYSVILSTQQDKADEAMRSYEDLLDASTWEKHQSRPGLPRPGVPGADDHLGPVRGLQLREDAGHVVPDRLRRQVERTGDLGVVPACRDQVEHLGLPLGELGEWPLRPGHRCQHLRDPGRRARPRRRHRRRARW